MIKLKTKMVNQKIRIIIKKIKKLAKKLISMQIGGKHQISQSQKRQPMIIHQMPLKKIQFTKI